MNQKSKKTRAQNQNQESSSSSSILSLPEDILMHCIALVPKQNYRNLFLVCKLFRSIVTSPNLFATRSLLNCTESCIYVSILDRSHSYIRWYTLIHNKLVLVTSLPPMPSCERYAAIGSKIFSIGGSSCDVGMLWKSDVYVIDCRVDVAKSIVNMPELVTWPIVSDVVDGKIYVFGDSEKRSRKTEKPRMLVLDTEAETWEYDTRLGLVEGRVDKTVALDGGKIYVQSYGFNKDFVFDPKEGKFQEFSLPDYFDYKSLLSILREEKGCVVIDEILYTFDFHLKAYDLKQRLDLGVVKGTVEGLDDMNRDYRVTAVSCGNKKMMLFFHHGKYYSSDGSRNIWCAEITLMEKKDKNGRREIWGNVEWCQVVNNGYDFFRACVTVTV